VKACQIVAAIAGLEIITYVSFQIVDRCIVTGQNQNGNAEMPQKESGLAG
jgi:hypothetical protein